MAPRICQEQFLSTELRVTPEHCQVCPKTIWKELEFRSPASSSDTECDAQLWSSSKRWEIQTAAFTSCPSVVKCKEKLTGLWGNGTLTNLRWKCELFHLSWKAIWKLLLTFKRLTYILVMVVLCLGTNFIEIKQWVVRMYKNVHSCTVLT